ncbi:hypothetical protein [Clostridium sp.]|uniref:hypothetical protein n=1 Tax=Clostridium sp. TaxID=1506 RepID=UPI002FC9759E
MKITLDQFKCIIRNLCAIDKKFVAIKPCEEAQFYINLLEPALSIMLDGYYGESNSNEI